MYLKNSSFGALLGCLQEVRKWVRINGLFHLLINGVYWGYNPLTNLFLSSWDIPCISYLLNPLLGLKHPLVTVVFNFLCL